MDKEKAAAVLAAQLRLYRNRSYAELKDLLGQVDAYEVTMPGGSSYQIEIQVFWDSKSNGNIRVIGAIDDGKWRAFSPLSDDFIMTPDGAFLGE
jgi:hypothetical protein